MEDRRGKPLHPDACTCWYCQQLGGAARAHRPPEELLDLDRERLAYYHRLGEQASRKPTSLNPKAWPPQKGSRLQVIAFVVVAVAVVAGVLAALYFSSGVGTTTIKMRGSSMEPAYPAGAVVKITSDFEPADVEVGSVVVFPSKECKGLKADLADLVMHRVVQMQALGGTSDAMLYRTKGDANSHEDPCWLRFEDLAYLHKGGTP